MAGTLTYDTSLSDALVILGAAGIVIPAFARARITPVIGFILVGLAVGPFGLGSLVPEHRWLYYFTITRPEAIGLFAEFGVILLLFEIGLELSFARLWQMRRAVFGLGALKLACTSALIALVLLLLGNSWKASAGLGLALALSSTALILPIVGTESRVGRTALALLLFEDIALVPIIFLIGAMGPTIAGHAAAAAGGTGALLVTVAKGTAVIVAMLAIGKFLLPRLFASAARTKSPEIFLAFSLLVVIAAALATGAIGLSPIMGALLAGLLIAETEYSREVEALTGPFKGLALGVFLITVGMGIDLRMVWAQAGPLALAVLAVLGIKALMTWLVLRATGKRRGAATELGLLMASPSETTLIVLSTAAGAGLIAAWSAQFWQAATAIGLTLTPLLAIAGRRISGRIDRPAEGQAAPGEDAEGRALIFGYGRVGTMIGEMLRRHEIDFLAIDADPAIIDEARRGSQPVVYGNVSNERLLERLHLGDALALIVTMDEPVLVSRVVRRIHQLHPDLPIIVRARDTAHAAELYRAGASHAVPETLESSLQLSEAVLVDLGTAMGPVIASIHEMRDELREEIMREGGLSEKPRLRTGTLRESKAK